MQDGKNPEPWRPNWAYTGEAELGFLLAEAKEALQGTIDLGISSDQRSATLAGVFGAGAFALFTVAATIFASQDKPPIFLFGALFVGLLLLVASGLCTLAASPGDFFAAGYEPKLLFPSATDLRWMQRYTIEDIQARIEANRLEIEREARFTKWAIYFALAAMICSFAFVSIGVLQIQHANTLSPPSSGASSAQAGEVEMTLPVLRLENYCCSPHKLLIGKQDTTPPPQKQH